MSSPSPSPTSSPSPTPSTVPPSNQPGCSVGQPMDSYSGCGPCGGAAGSGGAPSGGLPGGVPRSYGTPSWSINLYSLNLLIRDTPAFYTPGLGPRVAWDLTFNSTNPNPSSDVGPFNYLFGPNVSSTYLAHVVDLGTAAHVVMPDGRVDWYTPINPSGNPVNYAPASGTGIYNTLTKDTTHNLFTLSLKDHSDSYTFAKAFTWNGTNYYALTKIADQVGQAVTLGYSSDPMPKLQSLTDANGHVSQVVYNANGQASQVNDPFSGYAQFGYTSVGGLNLLSSITDQASYTSLLGYNANGQLTSLTTPLTAPNPTWQFGYGQTGNQVTSVTDPYGHTRKYTVPTSTTTVRTDELGRQTTYDFSNNGFGGPGVITDAAGNKTQRTFDGNRNVTQLINARNYFSNYTYDGNGNLLTATDYLNPYPDTSVSIQRSWTYDGNNNMLSATDPLGTESWTYNGNNQALTWTDKLGKTANYSYSGLGQLLTVKDRNGITAVTNTYDGTTGRLTSTADALGNTTKFAWDSRGRQTQVTDPAGNATSYTYDLLDRVTVTTFPDSTTIQNAYNCCELTQITDQLSHLTKLAYDNLARLTSVTDPTNAVVGLAYDAVGNLTSLTDPNNHTWQAQYDALNRGIKQIDPLSHQETWAYDAVGNVTQHTDGNNAATSYTYDALNRLTKTTYPDNSTVAMTYDGVGNRLTVNDALGAWSWAYNANSWLTSATTPTATSATQYQYDNEGNRTKTTDPDGNAIATAYDAGYRVSSVQFPLGMQNLTVSYQHDPRGLVTQRNLPDGVVSTYGYDKLSRTTSIQHARSNTTVLFSFAYQYDSAGNLTQETSQRWDTGLNATASYQADYGYDARYELTSEKYYKAGTFILELDYSYDPAGNRTRYVNNNPTSADSPVTITSSYTADNQIAQAVRTAPLDPTQTTNYSEDGNGSLTQATAPSGTTGFQYDFERRLSRINLPNGTNIQFGYSADSLRVQKTGSTGAVTDYVLDDLRVLLEKNNAGATQVRFVPAVAQIVSGAASYYLEDRLGSIVGLVDANQSITDTFRYDAWGNQLQQQGSTTSAYQWVGGGGYYFNSDTGLYLMGLRHYSPTTGLFLNRDPIGFSGDYVNIYRYSYSRALNGFDPTGTQDYAAFIYFYIPYGGGRGGPLFGPPAIGGGFQLSSPGYQGPMYFDPYRPVQEPSFMPVRPIFITPPNPSTPLRLRPVVGQPYTDPFLGVTLYPLYYPGRPSPIPGIRCNDGRIYPVMGNRYYSYLNGPGGVIYLPSDKFTIINPPFFAPR